MEKNMGYQICNRCVMDTSDLEIQFDHLGNCNHCNNYFNNFTKLQYQGETSDKIIRDLVKKIKDTGRGRQYDCLIGVSGGVDSSYVAFLVKELGLRPLAVHMDNGWDSIEAIENIKKLNDDGHIIGLHSHTHPTMLSKLSKIDQEKEYQKNYKILYDSLKNPPKTVSHPCNSYNNDTLSVLRNLKIEIGFRANMENHLFSEFEFPREDHANIIKMIGL